MASEPDTPAAAPAVLDSALAEPSRRAAAPPDAGALAAGDEDAAADAEAMIEVRGRLVRPGGAPAANERLRFIADFDVGRFRVLERSEEEADEPVETGSDGRFRLTAPRGRDGMVRLEATDWVFEGDRVDVVVAASQEDVDLGDLLLAPAAQLAGAVRDEAGQPVADVAVSLQRGGQLWAADRAQQSDAAGRFAFRGLVGGQYELVTASPRFLPSRTKVRVESGGQQRHVLVTLKTGRSIAGRVVDDLGQPVEGILVGSYRHRELGSGMQVTALAEDEAVKTAADGTFVLGGIGELAVTVRARGAGYAAARQANVQPGTRDVSLVLQRLANIRGVLRDTTGRAIVGSRVKLDGAGGPQMMVGGRAEAVTDASGAFLLEGVIPGQLTVRAEGRDHVAVETEVAVRAGETVEDVELVASRGASLTARVLDHEGQPVAGAEVVVKEGPPPAAGPVRSFSRRVERRIGDGEDHVHVFDGSPRELGSGRTGADGTVVIGGLPAGTASATATHDELAPSLSTQIELTDVGVETTLRLRRGGGVELVAVDANQQPLADAPVELKGPLTAGVEPSSQVVRTDAEGRAQVPSLVVGSYSAALQQPPRAVHVGSASFVMMGADGGGTYDGSRVTFDVAAGETANVTLVRPVLTTLEGTLRDATGPVAGGRIEVSPLDQPAAPMMGGPGTATNRDGRYSIADLAPGRYRLRYGRKDQLVLFEEEIELAGQRQMQDLMLRGGIVRLTVTDHRGEPLAGAKVTLEKQSKAPQQARTMMFAIATVDGSGGDERSLEIGGGSPFARTDSDGVAEVADVPEGEYTIEVSHAQHITQKLPDIEVRPSATRELEPMQLARGGSIQGRVVADGGGRVGFATVELTPLDDPDGDPETTPAMRGAFRFSGIAPGRYQLRARGMGASGSASWGPASEVRVDPGEVATTELALEP